MLSRVLLCLALFAPGGVFAVTGVHPQGVNVNATGVTSAFLTFHGVGAGEQPIDAYWCGDLVVSGGPSFVTAFDPCVPGTLFGRLPARNDLSRPSGTGGVRNLTDVMTIPASVARRAYQAAQTGAPPDFFYVRRFRDGLQDTYVTITCRLTAGGARVPLALTEVRLAFDTPEGPRAVHFLGRDQALPPFSAEIRYTGAGRLSGRWELMKPGDPEPTVEDLLPEASLPVERRPLQQRYTLIDRFDVFLPPTGSAMLPGPDPKRVASGSEGPYRILLRVEATYENEGNSDTGTGTVATGGVAGFPIPVLQFFLGTPESLPAAQERAGRHELVTLSPRAGAEVPAGSAVQFSWVTIPGAAHYLLELRSARAVVLNAVVGASVATYTAPPWALEDESTDLRWRVLALDAGSRSMARSDWRALRRRD